MFARYPLWLSLLGLCWLFPFSWVFAQDELRVNSVFTTEEIPQIPLSLLEDRLGFLWIGTTDGLYRYDGYDLREFRKIPEDTSSIVDNYIHCLAEGEDGLLWVGTNDGIASYHPDREYFQRYPNLLPPQSKVYAIAPDKKGRIWLATRNGLLRFYPLEDSVVRYLPDPDLPETSLVDPLVWDCYLDSRQRLWVATHGGFSVLDTTTDDPQPKSWRGAGAEAEPGKLLTDRVFKVAEQPKGTIWLATYDGIFRVEEENEDWNFHRLSSLADDPSQQLRYDLTLGLKGIGDDQLWAATYPDGLEEIRLGTSPDSLQIIHHAHEPGRKNSLPPVGIRTLTEANGSLWIAAKSQLLRGKTKPERFKHHPAASDNYPGLAGEVAVAVLHDSRGNLWVGHQRGLSWRPEGSEGFQHFYGGEDSAIGLSDDFVTHLSEDGSGNVWLATRGGGLHYLQLEELGDRPQFQNIFPERVRAFNRISGILETNPGNYLVATDYGLRELEFDAGQADSFRESAHVSTDTTSEETGREGQIVNDQLSALAQDRFGDAWVATGAGLSRVRTIGENVYYDNYRHDPGDPTSLSHNAIRCLFRDGRGRLWVGTRSGLNLVVLNQREERATFKKFGLADGLTNDVIHTIEADNAGMLWFTTNRGLVHFDPDPSHNQKPVIRTYTGGGIPLSTFVYRSSCRAPDGHLYFGTADGLVSFHPERIKSDTRPPLLRFTQLKVLNETVRPRPEGPILTESIATASTIRLHHTDNLVTLSFTALDFREPDRNRYRYRFSALGEDWIDNGHNHELTLTNIPDGHHRLEVLGSNADGVWATEPLWLIIHVNPPPWRSWWAYLLYLLALGGLGYFVFRYRLDRRLASIREKMAVEKARLETRQVLRDRNAADFHDELGHRLTKIQLYTTLAERGSPKPEVGRYLSRIKEDTIGLTVGIRDLIWSLDTRKDSLFATLVRLRDFGDELFVDSPTLFSARGLDPKLESVGVEAEGRKHLLLLFKEAMNNCFKYAVASKAELSCVVTETELKIIFQDNGIGFDPSKAGKGYGLRNMYKRAEQLGGKLTINSQVEQTSITFRLQLEYPKGGSVSLQLKS